MTNGGLATDVKRQEGSADFSMAYGLPGKPGYRYTRPFDYFHFEFTAVPNASTVANAIENVSIRGLLVGAKYEWGDDVSRRVGPLRRTTTTCRRRSSASRPRPSRSAPSRQWWLSRAVALQGTALGRLGFGAAGTVADRAERDYHYGLIPQALLGLRLIFGDRACSRRRGASTIVAGTGSRRRVPHR